MSWAGLRDPSALQGLDAVFDARLRGEDPELHRAFAALREGGAGLSPPQISELLIGVARHLSAFVARLFGVENEARRLREETAGHDPVWALKEHFKKSARGVKDVSAEELPALEQAHDALRTSAFAELRPTPSAGAAGANGLDDELWTARMVQRLAELADANPEARARLAAVTRFLAAAAAAHSPRVRHWSSLHLPHALDFQNLVPLGRPRADLPEWVEGGDRVERRRRDGFKLTDPRMGTREVLGEVNYCLFCHEREKDSCSTGFHEKAGGYKKNPLGIPLAGCPLDERISEMHTLRREGDPLGALALVCADNPMLPGTGHRICNDCMKACIFQKQEPVNIPQIETGVLTDVLALPWGFEIWDLLTRWNPLAAGAGRRSTALPYNGKNVLVVGLGPAGYTLSHHLLNEGFGVVAVDGLKIEPLPRAWLDAPIRDFRAEVASDLDARVLAGFGGVAEYGITVRWDKNFLTAVHIALSRRERFRSYGGVRFGGTLEIDDAWALGFHHVAIAAGAGKPTVIPMKNNLIRGIRKASDFLMALQLTGAFKKSAMANLQVRLPAIVIGGGLTAIDTATELAAYYPQQVEKTLERFETLAREMGEEAVWKLYVEEERHILHEFLAHGREVRAERARAAAAPGSGEAPDLMRLVRKWGGVSIAYRKDLGDSPAYRLNHEEVWKCFEEGIAFAERLSPVEAIPDDHGAVRALRFERQAVKDGKWRATGEIVELPARSVCIAAGTSPNIIYEKEHPGTFELDPAHGAFKAHDLRAGALVADPDGFFTSYLNDGRTVTFYGDNHPRFAGSVVKAMASAKLGYPHVVTATRELTPSKQPWERFTARVDEELRATVHAVVRLTPTIVEVIVRAPLAARRFRPGQFYRLQNYETDSPVVDGSALTMEGLALTGAWTDPQAGLLSLIVLELGASSRLCAALKPGQRVVVMGPTGAPSEIPKQENVVLCGGGLGNAVLFSIAKALRDNGCKVVYFAGYRKPEDVFKRDEIETACDQVIWSVDSGPMIPPRRAQDRTFRGNIVQAMQSWAAGELGDAVLTFAVVDRIIAIGSDRMMAAVTAARRAGLLPFLKRGHAAIASINSSMQCMMKEVCAQCLQRHVDHATGKESFVFSCFNQDQSMDVVDWHNLASRLRMNSVLEKLSNLWLERLLRIQPLERV